MSAGDHFSTTRRGFIRASLVEFFEMLLGPADSGPDNIEIAACNLVDGGLDAPTCKHLPSRHEQALSSSTAVASPESDGSP